MKTVANIIIFLGIVLIIFIFYPVIKAEVNYSFDKALNVQYSTNIQNSDLFKKPLVPPNKDFSIVIPKIAAVAPIVAGVDPTNPKVYLPALKKGVAQAKGTALPGDVGNVYLFAHSTDSFWNVSTYNAIFFLIGKLQSGDEIDIFYNGNLIKYQVYDKKVVSADSSQYFRTLIKGEKTLTLQTCYPPGTTFERLVVLAKQTP